MSSIENGFTEFSGPSRKTSSFLVKNVAQLFLKNLSRFAKYLVTWALSLVDQNYGVKSVPSLKTYTQKYIANFLEQFFPFP